MSLLEIDLGLSEARNLGQKGRQQVRFSESGVLGVIAVAERSIIIELLFLCYALKVNKAKAKAKAR